MAEVKLQENHSSEPLTDTKESLYDKALDRMNADQCIVQYAYKEENYRVAAGIFAQLGDFRDAPALAEKCRLLADQAREEGRQDLYEKTINKETLAENRDDWERIDDAYARLGDFKDAKERKAASDARLERYRTKNRNGWIRVIVLVVVLGSVIAAGILTGFFRYIYALGYQEAGLYRNAQAAFERLDGFMDSERKAIESELMGLRNASKGDSVYFGDYSWLVLRRSKDRLLLILQTVNKETTPEMLNHAYHDTDEDVTWEESDLRAWLNGPVLEEHFSEAERARMLPVNSAASINPQYRTAYETDCEDLVSILSVEQAEKRTKELSQLGLNWWLRTPGNAMNAAAYYASTHVPVLYGDAVTDDQMAVRPVILVNTGEED